MQLFQNPRNSREQMSDGLYAAGHQLLERERPADALLLFRAMLMADAEDERGWLAMATCHEQFGQLQLAEDLFAAGFHLAKAKVRCLVGFARLHAERDPSEAERLLEQAEELAVDDEELALVRNTQKFLFH